MKKLKTFLLIDLPYLCHVSHHAYGDLSHKGYPTGVLFGVFHYIKRLTEMTQSDRFVFCLDGKDNLRKRILPQYKANRLKVTYDKQEQLDYDRRKRQQDDLPGLLKEIGYKNVVCHDGYEADDLIARFYYDHIENRTTREAIVVSGDQDLYQLLSPNTLVWKGRGERYYTMVDFEKEYGIPPTLWSSVKAIGGCASDNLKPIPGVGESFALQYVKGEMKESERLRAIREYVGSEEQRKYLACVELPFAQHRVDFPGKIKLLRQKRISPLTWNRVMRRYDMTSLMRAGT